MRKMSKKLCAASLATLLVVFTACGQNGGQEVTTNKDNGAEAQTSTDETNKETEKGRTIVWASLYDQPEGMAFRKKYIEEPMQAAFPNDTIKFEVFTDRQSLQVQIAGGGGPDIMGLDGPTDAAELAKSGKVVSLDDYNKQYNWEPLFFDWAWGSSIYNGKLYSLPDSFEGLVIYYNKDVFEANGWQYPKTADEMVAIMKDAQSKNIIPISFGNSDYQGAVDWLYSTFLSCNAGPATVKEALQGKRDWTDPLMMGAMDQMVSWWQDGYIGNKTSQAVTNDDMVSLFADGKAAMMIDGTWAATMLINTFPECNWDIELVPELRSGVGRILPIATGGCVAINANSKQQDFAAELLNWQFTTVDRHMESVRVASFQPFPLKSIKVDMFKGMDERLVDMYKSLMDAQSTGNVGYCSWTFWPSDARVYMNENTDALFLGTLTTQAYMTKVQEIVNKALEDGTAPPLP